MRLFTISLLSAIALARSCSSGGTGPIEQSTAERFRNAIGVNVHLQYKNTRYRDERQVANALDYLGVKHVRDGAFRHGDDAFESYGKLARHGVLFDLFFNADLMPQMSRVDRLEQDSPGAVDLVEGPNEVNNDPVTFAGRSGIAGARAYQAALYVESKANGALARLPVLNYTNWPPTGGQADAVNAHTYAKPGVSTRAQMSRDVRLAAAALPRGLPRYITETGYPTSVADRSAPWVSPKKQADLTLITLLEAFRFGVRRTYLYELFDEGDASNQDSEAHFGMFDSTGAAKPSAIYLHVLLSEMQLIEKGPLDSRHIKLDVQGAPSLLLTTKSGSEILLTWTRRGDMPHQVGVKADRLLLVRELVLETGRLVPVCGCASWQAELTTGPRAFVLSPT